MIGGTIGQYSHCERAGPGACPSKPAVAHAGIFVKIECSSFYADPQKGCQRHGVAQRDRSGFGQ